MTASMTRRRLTWAFGLLALVAVALPATAQQQSTPTPPPPAKEEEVPFWAMGKPKTGPGAEMAPVPAFPIPTPADKLPIAKMKVPAGLQGRGLRERASSTRAACAAATRARSSSARCSSPARSTRSSRRAASARSRRIAREARAAERHRVPQGRALRGDAQGDHALRRHRGQPRQAAASRSMVYDKLPGDVPHGWKFIRFGPDGKLYVPVGAPCNICDAVATSTRRSSASTWTAAAWRSSRAACATRWASTSIPKTKELWFTDNQRDWLSEDLPLDELNRLDQARQGALRLSLLPLRATSPIPSSAGASRAPTT